MSVAASPAPRQRGRARPTRRPGGRRARSRPPRLPAMSVAASRGGPPARQQLAERNMQCAVGQCELTMVHARRRPDHAGDAGSPEAVASAPSTPGRRAHRERARAAPGDATRGLQGRARPATARPGRHPPARPALAGIRRPGAATARSSAPTLSWPSHRRGPTSAHHTTCPLPATSESAGRCADTHRGRRDFARAALTATPARSLPAALPAALPRPRRRPARAALSATRRRRRTPGDARTLIADGSDFRSRTGRGRPGDPTTVAIKHSRR